jgi:hypothetical protein
MIRKTTSARSGHGYLARRSLSTLIAVFRDASLWREIGGPPPGISALGTRALISNHEAAVARKTRLAPLHLIHRLPVLVHQGQP